MLDRAGGYVRMCRHWYRTLPAGGRPADDEQFVTRMAAWARDGRTKHEIYSNLLRWWPGCFAGVEAAIDCHRMQLAPFTPLDPRTRCSLATGRWRTSVARGAWACGPRGSITDAWEAAAPPPDYTIAGAWEVGDLPGVSSLS